MVDPALRDHVCRYGHNATAYQTLNAGFEHARFGDAVVGYVRARAWPAGPGVWVAAGVPIGPPRAVGPAVAAFDASARARRARAVWFGVEADEVWHFPHHAALVVGAQPVWAPGEWGETLAAHASLRAQVRRAANKGVEVDEWPVARAAAHPGLRRCLREWTQSRGLPALRFLTDPFVLDHLGDRRVFVAQQAGSVVAYAVLAPVPARDGWLAEWLIQGAVAPNGTAARLLDAAMRAVAAEGAAYVTLGLAPLSSTSPPSASPPPLVVRALLAWTRAHARRFYNFEGLERFKAKFRPVAWEPVRLCTDEARVSLATLYALADAFAGGRSPVGLVGEAVLGAAADETKTTLGAARRVVSSRPGS